MSKSPIAILRAAHEVARGVLPDYSHPCSPRKYTQPQLFACLALMVAERDDYRALEAKLRDSPAWRAAIGLAEVPCWSTFRKAYHRLRRDGRVRGLMDRAVRLATPDMGAPAEAAVDSTGLRPDRASRYYARRAREAAGPRRPRPGGGRRRRRYPKPGPVVDRRTHLILAAGAGTGPRPDVDEFVGLLRAASRRRRPGAVLADAGYDSEANHRFARQASGLRVLIRRGRPTREPGPPRTAHRRLTEAAWDESAYGQRWQVETVVSMLKRRLGEFCRSRTAAGRRRDLHWMALVHNILILHATAKEWTFSTEQSEPISGDATPAVPDANPFRANDFGAESVVQARGDDWRTDPSPTPTGPPDSAPNPGEATARGATQPIAPLRTSSIGATDPRRPPSCSDRRSRPLPIGPTS